MAALELQNSSGSCCLSAADSTCSKLVVLHVCLLSVLSMTDVDVEEGVLITLARKSRRINTEKNEG